MKTLNDYSREIAGDGGVITEAVWNLAIQLMVTDHNKALQELADQQKKMLNALDKLIK